MTLRLWYPQLDVYDTIRRMSILLNYFENPPGIERLYMADFYLASPSLLHLTTMPNSTREAFKELKIVRPEKNFVSYPSPQILFHKMEATQKQALVELSGRGLVAIELLDTGTVHLTEL